MSLDELIERRSALQVALAVHEASLQAFRPTDGGVSFRITLLEELAGDPGRGKPRHLTSTASCFEALADVHPGTGGVFPQPDERDEPGWGTLAEGFARRALETPGKDWLSDGAAHVYCRLRTLPMVLRYVRLKDNEDAAAVAAKDRLQEAFSVIDTGRPVSERGLGELRLDDNGSPQPPDKGQTEYPANAFHAYWGLKAHCRYMHRQNLRSDLPELDRSHLKLVDYNAAWVDAAIGKHVAYLRAGKRLGDAQQLIFAVLADLQHREGKLAPASAQAALYEAALDTFFAAQEPLGRWPLSRPLFHYPGSGNAYCFTFETLTELLRPALPREKGRVFRALLEPFLGQLFAAWDYAIATRVPLDESGTAFGWCSTHHVGRDVPEAWATAEVFSFGQLLRCVSGHALAERAGQELGARRPEYASVEKAQEQLAKRGRTWAEDGWTVGRTLASMFLHPKSASHGTSVDHEKRDPDAPLMGEEHARSAVLFGPPGTGKTSIVEALAGSLGWQFVEVLASDFLSEGVDSVPARADRIFELLMQLDRCVVLFDEIDELIQERSRDDSDPFGRFLTTSMLPKIAKLWKQRRLIFFVATNHVSRADAAITRTSRFDARIFVAPPGLEVKRALLTKQLGHRLPPFDDEDVKLALSASEEDRKTLSPQKAALSVLPLLRYDQVPELVRLLERGNGNPSVERLYQSLALMGERLLRHEWAPAKEPEGWATLDYAGKLRAVYHRYRVDVSRDFSRQRLMRSDVDIADVPAGATSVECIAGSAGVSLYTAPDDLTDLLVDGEAIRLTSASAGDVDDHGLLWFRAERAAANGQ